MLVMKLQQRDTKISKLESQLRHVNEQLDQQEQYSRRNCLIIHGIPEVATTAEPENTDKRVIQEAKNHLVPTIPPESLDRTHRIGAKLDKTGKPKTRPIIVKFVAYKLH